ncbi:hypothetical protein MLD38_022622 [Melastoma candidum]|uniref:Uncharacterized protein n=1 Tax=Melastoma candidum TaxID=119954 RepID=A0ACB9QKZ1_9MYRT|nr:hypothetical protein MLD38_022622 [Melastoma candidum]
MVLGPGQKHGKGPSVRVEYIVHVQDIKPWPPSQSLRSLRSVVIQWENGEKCTGMTCMVVPYLGTGTNDGKIEFNETFRLPVNLVRDTSVKSGDVVKFRKNCLELHLYELRRDKISKGQLIGTAVVDLADHGIIKESRTISTAMNCQRVFRNTTPPTLHLKILPASKIRMKSSSLDDSSIQSLLDGKGSESFSAFRTEAYVHEANSNSLTKDDVPYQSSVPVPGTLLARDKTLSPKKELDEAHDMDKSMGRDDEKCIVLSKPEEDLEDDKSNDVVASEECGNEIPNQSENPAGSVPEASDQEEISTELGCKENVWENVVFPSVVPAVEKFGAENFCTAKDDEDDKRTDTKDQVNVEKPSKDDSVDRNRTDEVDQVNGEKHRKDDPFENNRTKETDPVDEEKSVEDTSISRNGTGENNQDVEEKGIEDNTASRKSIGDPELKFPALDGRENHEINAATASADRSKYLKSVRSTPDLNRNNGVANNNQLTGDGQLTVTRSSRGHERYVYEYSAKDTRSRLLESKVQQLESKIQLLEGELREAAAIEFALFSVVAEHGSSHAKVHAPARRLSRLYFYACKQRSQSRRASAAKSAVSGLVLVAKACGNDVSRLTYWLSNTVMLRMLVSRRIKNMEMSLLSTDRRGNNSSVSDDGVEMPSLLKWNSCSSNKLSDENFATSYDLEDPRAFVSTLEKVEAWIFSRTAECVWWQTFTPYMQSSGPSLCNVWGDLGSGKSNGDVINENNVGHGDFSLEIWRTAFKDALRRLCPVRSGAHECGCLQMLPRLVMEQCIARLDGAMFNAILGESPEASTVPIPDLISDPKVLPIPAGQSSFGTGAQLKTVIGNWSRWLMERFGKENDCMSVEEMDAHDHGINEASFKCFHLLSAVSDLMMLPKDMLLSESVRKEVCPMFGMSMIRRILRNFVPDEFCPDPIPDAVFESLDSGDHLLDGEDSNVVFPYVPPPMKYVPPSPANVIGEDDLLEVLLN